MKLVPIEHSKQRILTTQQLAEAYGTQPQIIANNYNRNRSRYEEGKHFYCLEGEAKRDFCNQNQFDDGSKNANRLYLWTEKGAYLHAKSLNTDQAWNAYESLVDEYYSIKESSLPPSLMNDPIIAIRVDQIHMKTRIESLEAETGEIRAIISDKDKADVTGDKRQQLKGMMDKYSQKQGISYRDGWRDFRDGYNTAFRTNIKLKMRNYQIEHGIKKMTMPEYLEATGCLDDALRIANKLLNPTSLRLARV